MKRCLDIFGGTIGLFLSAPFVLLSLFAIWLSDRQNPLYRSTRIGRYSLPFTLYKVRTMRIDADSTGEYSSRSDDQRLLAIGKIIRRLKIDELPQLINVLNGTMSLVGPRPNVSAEVRLYTNEEKKLLTIRPGITDFSSIVFSDLGEILNNSNDVNLAYRQLVRPWKSRLGLFYVDRSSFLLDCSLIAITILNSISRKSALKCIASLLKYHKADVELVKIARRTQKLVPGTPPGSDRIAVALE